MADLASYSFLPWLRRGIATQIARGEGEPAAVGSDPARVAVPVSITLNGALTTTIPLTLLSAGDVVGVDRDAIIRVYPLPGVFDTESNYFPLLEFDQADFPWRYTPAAARSANRLTPWVCLIVLTDNEIENITEPATTGALPQVKVFDADLLPLLSQAWAWAHVQISGNKNPTDEELRVLLDTAPHRAISRLIGPRRLEPNTSYTAFLVPTFERGRRAGCGEKVPNDLDALAPAWGAHGAVQLPVYFRWRFGTGAAGDFEFLVRQLEARVLPPTIGKRAMDVSDPGTSLPPAFTDPLGLEGALSAIGMQRTEWTGPVRQTFLTRLAKLLNLAADRLEDPTQDRIVVPPLYGRWHALSERLVPGQEPTWFNDLNQDPRERTAAGAGTRVVQQQQRQLMASAWRQVQGIREANERLRLTQLARELATRVYKRHVPLGNADQLLQVGAPVLTRIQASPETIHARMLESPVLPGLLESQFRRVARPRGPVGRRQGRPSAPAWTGFSRLNHGDLKGPAPASTSKSLTTPKTAPPTPPAWGSNEAIARLRWQSRWFPILGILLIAMALIVASVGSALLAVLAGAAGGGLIARGRVARLRVEHVERVRALAGGTLSAEQLAKAPVPNDFVPAEAAPGTVTVPATTIAARSGPASPGVSAFRNAAGAALTRLADPIATPAALQPLPLNELQSKVVTALNPKITTVAGLRDRLVFPGVARQPTEDEVEPVMAAPAFPQPMYAPLAALSQDWMLPGLEQVPPNTVTTALTNQRFIEAYMVGLNHEMARELQWNEYPTDMRGTYFRQFWDPAGSGGDPAQMLDITPHHTWNPPSQLGRHPVRPPPPGGQHLVLLVRGELFRRYPNTQVYAVKAKAGVVIEHELGDEDLLPVFSGRLPPDVTFFGFTLTPDEVRGDEGSSGPNQGWFFVLQEQPSEPRFGMDVAETLGGRPAKWSDLSWGHLALSDAELTAIRYVDLAATLPDTSQVNPTGGAHWHVSEGARASDLAFITLQQPMRVAVHGSDMVPPETP